ncbi:hypothetical protein VFPPC_16518 [Pochonia chlamydosporia 170]|uniref:Uncharacterized protein n=1 Tax=Pochonia chlamydosporia 170 TaxID=1380566 RepID=A0A179F7N7_METCM|nr:hypothetical protein VFPPC_16518 [Pochonia chlamydosporia 170]OAQ61495.1 hypothetical protein VFPPC_16518 [Pochonia chlamydosporia 170]
MFNARNFRHVLSFSAGESNNLALGIRHLSVTSDWPPHAKLQPTVRLAKEFSG